MDRDEVEAAVVLAAGDAQRFGSQKLLVPWGDSTVLGRVVEQLRLAALFPIIVVTGKDPSVGDWVRRAALGAEVVANPDPGRGMFSSVRVGVAALPEQVGRFVVALGDQPQVCAAIIANLLAAHRRAGGIVLPTYGGKRGHPVVFAGEYRREILVRGEDDTLRALIHTHSSEVLEVPCESDAVVRDLDTREDYERDRPRFGG